MRKNSVNSSGIDSIRFCKLSTVGGHGSDSAFVTYSVITFCRIRDASLKTVISFTAMDELRDFIPVVTSFQVSLLTIT